MFNNYDNPSQRINYVYFITIAIFTLVIIKGPFSRKPVIQHVVVKQAFYADLIKNDFSTCPE